MAASPPSILSKISSMTHALIHTGLLGVSKQIVGRPQIWASSVVLTE